MNAKTSAIACISAAAMLSLSGCSFNISLDSLVSPPSLNQTQTEIHKALVASAGSGFKLKYPMSGEYRSAYVVADIDGVDGDEAIVFYETSAGGTESYLRVNILDQSDGVWTSVLDNAGIGTDINSVSISIVGEVEEKLLFINFEDSYSGERHFRGYRYSDGRLELLISGACVDFDIFDIDGDGYDELVCFSEDDNSAYAEVWGRTATTDKIVVQDTEKDGTIVTSKEVVSSLAAEKNSGFELRDVVAMAMNANIEEITRGNVGRETPALFVDVLKGNKTLETQVIYYRNGVLVNSFGLGDSVLAKTSRPLGYNSEDIDFDGVIEIPIVKPFIGYEDYASDEQINMTEWYVFENAGLIKKYSSYYDISNGYCFMLPTSWVGRVTVKKDPVTDDVVFCYYNSNAKNDGVEIMRIGVVKRGNSEKMIENGYSLLQVQGQLEYVYKLAEEIPDDVSRVMQITPTEVMFNFVVR